MNFVLSTAFNRYEVRGEQISFLFDVMTQLSEALLEFANYTLVFNQTQQLAFSHAFRCVGECQLASAFLAAKLTSGADVFVMHNMNASLQALMLIGADRITLKISSDNFGGFIGHANVLGAKLYIEYLTLGRDILRNALIITTDELLEVQFQAPAYTSAVYGIQKARLNLYFEIGEKRRYSTAFITDYRFMGVSLEDFEVTLRLAPKHIKLGIFNTMNFEGLGDQVRVMIRFTSANKVDFVYGTFSYDMLVQNGTLWCYMMDTADICYETLNYYFHREIDGGNMTLSDDHNFKDEKLINLTISVQFVVFKDKIVQFGQFLPNIRFVVGVFFDVNAVLSYNALALSFVTHKRQSLCQLEKPQQLTFKIYAYSSLADVNIEMVNAKLVYEFTAYYALNFSSVKARHGVRDRFQQIESDFKQSVALELFVFNGQQQCGDAVISFYEVQEAKQQFLQLMLTFNLLLLTMVISMLIFRCYPSRTAMLHPGELGFGAEPRNRR